MSFTTRLKGDRWLILALFIVILCGCGGGGGGDEGGNLADDTETTPTITTGSVSVDEILAGSAKLATDDPSAPFTELPAGVSAVGVNSPPVVNFVIKTTDGRLVTGLTTEQIRNHRTDTDCLRQACPGDNGRPQHPRLR
jgi:hypothetical protein